MLNYLDRMPYTMLILVAVYMLLAPFTPPHVVEKLQMLKAGTLTKPIDIFDLLFHLAPSVVLLIKIAADLQRKGTL